MQQEGETFVSDSQSERQVGKKYKREDEDEGIEWEEQQPTGIFQLFMFVRFNHLIYLYINAYRKQEQ